MSAPVYYRDTIFSMGELDQVCNMIQDRARQGAISKATGKLVKEQVLVVNRSEFQSGVDRKKLRDVLEYARHEAIERCSGAWNAGNDAAPQDSDQETPVLTPTMSSGSASSISTQASRASKASRKSKSKSSSSTVFSSEPDNKSTDNQDSNVLHGRTLIGEDGVYLQVIDWTTTDRDRTDVTTNTSTDRIRNNLWAVAFTLFGADIKPRFTKTASIYLIVDLFVTMPAGMSVPLRLACMMFTFAIITRMKSRELTRLKETVLTGDEEVWTRHEIKLLNTWVLAAVGLGLMLPGQSAPYLKG